MMVIHIASGDLWGGAEAQLFTLAIAQRQLGLDVRFALLNEGLLADRLRQSGMPVTVLPEATLSTISILRSLVVLMKRERPDVVHTHRLKENILGSMAAYIAGTGVCLRTVHGDTEPAPSGSPVRSCVARGVDCIFAHYFQCATVAVSDELAERLSRRRCYRQIEVILNGVDIDLVRAEGEAARYSWPRQPNEVRICALGRLVPVKRIDLFLEACAEVSTRSHRAVRAFVIGDGPLRSQLEDQARRLPGVEFNFIGFVERPAAWLRSMDLMVITSDHEGLPMSLLEAMALGVPIVSRAVGGVSSVLQGTGFGALIDSDKPADIAAAMRIELDRFLLDAPTDGRPKMPESLTASGMAIRYRDLYFRFMPRLGTGDRHDR